MTKVIVYIATSQDEFIADKNGSVDWLPPPTDDSNDEFGYKVLMKRVQLIIMGSRSYRQILGFGDWAWSDKTTYVFSQQSLTTSRNDVFFVQEDVKSFMGNLKKQSPNQDVWLLGGARLIQSFAKENLIDECIITIIPTSLGDGIKLELPYENFTLIQTKPCSGGMTQKFYARK